LHIVNLGTNKYSAGPPSPSPPETDTSKPSGEQTIVMVKIESKFKAIASGAANKLFMKVHTPTLNHEFFSTIGDGTMKVLTIPMVTEEPGDKMIGGGTAIDVKMGGYTLLPGTMRLIKSWKLDRWKNIKTIWANTQYAGKDIPVHDVDPKTLPCLLALEPNTELVTDTVPLIRGSGTNCDGTPHTRNDGKPQRRFAMASSAIKPTADQ